jgi:predicted phosphoadenosine phosphosulfate sulfurtransferase
MQWSEYIKIIIDSYDHDSKKEVQDTINKYIQGHFKKSKMKVDEETPNPISGISWKWLCTIAIRGDFKGRQGGMMNTQAAKERERLGITLEEAIKLYK